MKKPLSDELRKLIKEKIDEGISIAEVSKNFNISRPTAYSIKNGKKIKKAGRKATFSTRKVKIEIKKTISKLKKRQRRISASTICENLNDPPSLRTVQRILKNNNEFVYVNSKRKIILTASQKVSRIEHIKEWFREKIDFSKVIFTDEARFSLDGPDYFMSWELDKDDGNQFRQLRQMKGGSIMIYAFISYDGILEIRKLDGNLNGVKMKELLETDILPRLRARFGHNFILQQDNATPHKCKLVMDFLKAEGIRQINWPPYSPDLSIIENVFKMMKDMVYDGPDFLDRSSLWLKIEEVTESINAYKGNILMELYDGLCDRYLEVLEIHGDNK